MTTLSPTSTPTSFPTASAFDDRDLLPGLWMIAAIVLVLLVVRISHVRIARKSMRRNNYQSRSQWIASYSLNSLSIATGVFTLATIILNITRFSIGTGNGGEDGVEDILDVIFFFCYALQNLSVRFFRLYFWSPH